MEPLISVIMPHYNHGRYVGKALDAILAQSVSSFEILLVDDASNDDSLTLIRKYAEKYPQIQLECLQKNVGPVAAMNIALRKARGKYLAFCSADDAILPGFFEESLSLLQQYPEAGLCMSNFCFFQDDQEDALMEKRFPKMTKACYLNPEQLVQAIRKHNFWVPCLSSIVRKDLAAAYGFMRENLYSICDWFLILSIAFRHGLCYLPKALTSCRMTPQSYCVTTSQARTYAPFFALLETEEFQDIKEKFLTSGILFQLNKEVMPFMLRQKSLRAYVPRIFMQKVIQKKDKHRHTASFQRSSYAMPCL